MDREENRRKQKQNNTAISGLWSELLAREKQACVVLRFALWTAG